MRRKIPAAAFATAVLGLVLSAPASAGDSFAGTPAAGEMEGMVGPMFMMPIMNSARGRKVFAAKGCVVCHSVNGVGGEDAPPLDYSGMSRLMNPFEFAAKMWRGAEAMIVLQQDELGEQIELSGQDLADLVAFAHDPQEQDKFSEKDLPPKIRELIEHGDGEEEEGHN